MRSAGSSFITKLDDEVITFARLWTIDLTNGTSVYLTDHDQDIVYSGHTYKSNTGFTASAVMSSSKSVSNGATLSFPISIDITEDMCRSGAFDGAECTLDLIDWQATGNGVIRLFKGVSGAVAYDNIGNGSIEIEGLYNSESYINVETYSTSCRADLGDTRCKFNIDSMKASFTVDVVSNKQKFSTLELNQSDEYWTLGVLQWTSGNNNGLSIEVAKSVSSTKEITIYLPMAFAIETGDTGFIWPGCKKTVADCRDRYSNLVNFRGEPFSPGLDAATAYPQSTSTYTGRN